MNKTAAVAIAFVFFAACSLVFVYGTRLPSGSNTVAVSNSTGPDYTLTDVNISGITTDGTGNYTLAASKLRHYREREESVLTDPVIKLVRQTGYSREIVGDKAVLFTQTKEVHLEGNVRVTEMNSAEALPTITRTESMVVQLDSWNQGKSR